MDPVTGAVVIAGLQKFGGPASELVKDFLSRILSPTGDALGSALAHPIAEWQKRRVERGKKLLEDAAAALQKANQEPQAVPARVLMPLLERGSLEDDDELRERWVALLANAAADPDGIIPAFVSMLAELSPQEARLLRRLFTVHAEQRVLRESGEPNDPEVARKLDDLEDASALGRLKESEGVESEQHFNLILGNLTRLGLVAITVRRKQKELHVCRLTHLGRSLVQACSRPQA